MRLRDAVHREPRALLPLGCCRRQVEGGLHEDARFVPPFLLHKSAEPPLTCPDTDDRFIVKQLSRPEMVVFARFAPAYFEYMADALFNSVSKRNYPERASA